MYANNQFLSDYDPCATYTSAELLRFEQFARHTIREATLVIDALTAARAIASTSTHAHSYGSGSDYSDAYLLALHRAHHEQKRQQAKDILRYIQTHAQRLAAEKVE